MAIDLVQILSDHKAWLISRRNKGKQADLRDGNFSNAYLDGLMVNWAKFGGTNISNVDLRNVDGLVQCKHWSASSLGTDTIFRSKGKNTARVLKRLWIARCIDHIYSVFGCECFSG